MRIVAGAWRGRTLVAPVGSDTRPTADRVRQALFDMLAHAPWAPPEGVRGQIVLDAFAGTGALGLEALSRGAERAIFIERDGAAVAALRANVKACRAERALVVQADAFRPPPSAAASTLVFLDPPYGKDAAARALFALGVAGWIASGALVVVETERAEPASIEGSLLAKRTHGAARLSVFKVG